MSEVSPVQNRIQELPAGEKEYIEEFMKIYGSKGAIVILMTPTEIEKEKSIEFRLKTVNVPYSVVPSILDVLKNDALKPVVDFKD